MASANPLVQAFNAGRLGPRLQARVDLAKYQAGCNELENFIPTVQGPAVKRPGTRFALDAKYADKNVRLVSFEYSREQAYMLEFGEQYVRIFQNGAPLLEATKAIVGSPTNPSYPNQVVVEVTGHGFSDGDVVHVQNSGMTSLNGGYFVVDNATTHTFELEAVYNGGYPTGTGGTVARVYTLTTGVPYLSADVDSLAFEQSNDVLFIASPNHPPAKLSRLGALNWSYSAIAPKEPPFNVENGDQSITVGASAATGTSVTLTASSAIFKSAMIGSYVRLRELYASEHPKWKASTTYLNLGMTSSSAGEGLVYYDGRVYDFAGQAWWNGSRNPEKSATGQEPPVHDAGTFDDGKAYSEWTYVNDGYGYGKILSVGGNTSPTAGLTNTVCVIDVNTDGVQLPASVVASGFTYQPGVSVTSVTKANPAVVTAAGHNYANGDYVRIDGTGMTIDGNTYVVASADIAAGTFTLTGVNTLTETDAATDGVVYRRQAGAATSRWTISAWSGEYGYPRSVAFHQDRLFWGGTTSFPQTVWGSGVADYENYQAMGEHAVGLDFTLHNRKQNAIEWLIGHEDTLFIGTRGGEFTLGSQNRDEALSRDNFQVRRRSEYGCRPGTQAMGIDAGIVFAQRAGQKIHELKYQFESDSFVAPDLTALCEDILDGNVKQMVLQHEPYRLLWCITEDGKLRSLTYERTQDVVAWATHELGGKNAKVLSIAVIPHPDGDQDQLWMLVERDVDTPPSGAKKRTIEYLARPWEPNTARKDAQFLDLAVTRSFPTGLTFTSAKRSHSAYGTIAAIQTSNMNDGVAGDFVRLVSFGNGQTTGVGRVYLIGSVTTNSSDRILDLVPHDGLTTSGPASGADLPSGPGTWEIVSKTVRNVYPLAFSYAAALVDGEPVAVEYVPYGVVTFDAYGNTFQIGLPYESKVQTMRLEVGARAGTAQGKTKRINRVVARLDQTGPGLEYGTDFTTMDEVLPSSFNAADAVVPLVTGDTQRLALPSGYDKDGRIALRHSTPLPATIVGLFPMMKTEEGG